MNSTLIGLTFCLCAAVVILSVFAAYQQGKKDGAYKQAIGNVSNSNINQSHGDLGDLCLVQQERGILSPDNVHMDEESKDKWLNELKKELAKQVGIECFKKGYMTFEIQKDGFASKLGTKYDILTAKLWINLKSNHKPYRLKE
jgi:hypothetical protein